MKVRMVVLGSLAAAACRAAEVPAADPIDLPEARRAFETARAASRGMDGPCC
jgi:hypothetical protein